MESYSFIINKFCTQGSLDILNSCKGASVAAAPAAVLFLDIRLKKVANS